ncbi:T9SS type B sorting domain-containing protein [Winogradskyella immobilis]|uniref:T9SS type B sorting domain-containing protein n=1 Tax=Winogradskyella immobilis TaxID=2816852 RepID=A0ABS8ESI9_9FLAO|nr:choice-of-anchor L domain-containing protein [Winogradskyella immobilis]MCC1485262.1 T9SS type B sorting domain-containing protein [Winogradskyella immobilis]MCG0017354.1 T9SS type B sorting domain-containing protein [Winogradskyella immobilis]
MKWSNHILSICLCVISSLTFAQRISVDNTLSAQQLIEDTFSQGCVEISNITSPINGSLSNLGSFGYFQSASSNFPFQNGLVLTSGNANSAGNTTNNDVLNDGTIAWGGDTDLENILGISSGDLEETMNATVIEFDFISISNTVQFNYIFASENYFANFPCIDDFVDGFAFLIREVGTTAYNNIAVIPGTNMPIRSNNVHGQIDGFCNAENEQFFDGNNLGDTNYNGRTVPLTATAAIIPNVQYHIKLVIADTRDVNFDSAVFIEGNSFNAAVELGDDITTCASDVLLNANINNAQASYSWFRDNTLLNGEVQSSLNATVSGTYRVEIDIPLADSTCTITDEIVINLSNTQSSSTITDIEVCDDQSNDGVDVFNINSKDSEAINSVASGGNYVVSYHISETDAQNNNNPISGNYTNTSNPQTIFVRIEDVDNGCLAFNDFQLMVNPRPTITQPATLLVCDDQVADGFTEIDLNQVNDEITNGQSNLQVTYHFTQSDADMGINIIPMPYVNTSPNDMVFVSVINPQTGCRSTTTLDISLLENPVIANQQNYYIDACDQDRDGFANFDITSVEADILNGLTGVSITYHENEQDALSGSNPIADPTNYANTTIEEQIVFIRVIDPNTGCVSIAPIEIHSNLLLTGTNILDFSLCDIDNDGVEAFSFLSIQDIIVFDIPDLDVTFYESESDRDNGVNPIDESADYFPTSNPQTIYISISSPTCTEISEFDLILNEIQTFPPIGPQVVCDEDQDGFTTIDLTQFDQQLFENQSGFDVAYFGSQADAENNLNQLPAFYNNISNPFTVYARVRSSTSFCADVTSFEVEVVDAPIVNVPSPIIQCDDDQDGFFIINLEDRNNEMIGNTPDRSITFFNTQDDADANTNSISNPQTYNAQTEDVFARIENTITGCFVTQSLSIILNTLPELTTITDFRICENDTDNVGDFILSTKDAEILNGETDKQVFYFLNENDANNGNNPIDKFSSFQNTSNPQEIFVRVENDTDPDCFGVSSFLLEVGTNPPFNEPTDLFICDDMSNDTFETIDLDTIATQVTDGITESLEVTFYTTLEDAEASTNAVSSEFTNTSNPQEVFVQISNGSNCTSITSFIINVIPVPMVTDPEPFEQCDVNFDGRVNWDLTDSEVNILDVRQENISVSYFETLEEAELDANPIADPENFENFSNPQTVYIKVINTISNCPVVLPIELIINLPPSFNDFSSYEICDNSGNSFDLNIINDVIVDNTQDRTISYFSTLQDATNQTNVLDTNYTYQTTNDTIHIRIENTVTGCVFIYPFQLVVNPLPIANTPNDIVFCDDNFDGFLDIDLEEQTAAILGTQSNAIFAVTYHNSLDDANASNDALSSPYTTSDNETIYARVTNTQTSCFSTTSFNTIINPLPLTDIPDQTICPENFPLVVSAETGFTDDTYLWSTGETTPEIEITEIGTYDVTVTTISGCSVTSIFNVIESEPANIDVVEVVDFSDPNNVTITVTGIGDYIYQLDDFEPQESNFFENVGLGFHTLTIIDVNGCASVTREILVIDAPKFFTPNNDGDFDTWHIVGVETLPGTIVNIFDRYGKLLKQLSFNSRGWNGMYNGSLMPATDYWFSADVRRGDIAFTVKGHFALRR